MTHHSPNILRFASLTLSLEILRQYPQRRNLAQNFPVTESTQRNTQPTEPNGTVFFSVDLNGHDTSDQQWTNASRFCIFRLERMLVAEKLSYLLLVSTCKQPNELLNSPTAAAVSLLFFLSYSEVTWVLLRASSGHSLLALLRVCVSWCINTCIDFKLTLFCFGPHYKMMAALTFSCQTDEGFYLQVAS
ncbi:hypothetical protein AMECASPLE_027963 [Ameca splendens]|uniref:Uncharacterized protein n=1 Tax=Ameca splendens TaxID=208324 RepID=A0ABV1ACJ0_9TELE